MARMKVFNLQCASGHGFEGWFASEDDFRRQTDSGLLECPLCADKTVRRLPSAPRLNLTTSRASGYAPVLPASQSTGSSDRAPVQDGAGVGGDLVHVPASGTPEQQSVEALWMEAVRHVLTHTQDVGARFADEARRMHYGEVESRGIRGRTTPEEARALDDEGIEIFMLPVPEALKGPQH
ncbi:MAG: hypothetical protein RL375_2843 [Pseudomonadota bacterium]|jgi:hypothetical protein